MLWVTGNHLSFCHRGLRAKFAFKINHSDNYKTGCEKKLEQEDELETNPLPLAEADEELTKGSHKRSEKRRLISAIFIT